MVADVLFDARAKERRQALGTNAEDSETLIEFAVAAVVRICHVEVETIIEEIAPKDDFGRGATQSAQYVVSVLSGHHDDEVLTIKEVSVRVHAERSRF
jgi:hypothetical protein